MDDFGFQVSSQLDGLVILSRNIAFRVDRLKSRQMVSLKITLDKASDILPYYRSNVRKNCSAGTIVNRKSKRNP